MHKYFFDFIFTASLAPKMQKWLYFIKVEQAKRQEILTKGFGTVPALITLTTCPP